MSEFKSPDALVREIFRIQLEHNPHSDPGDITIEIQDDMPMVAIYQDAFDSSSAGSNVEALVRAQPTVGETIRAALESHLERVKAHLLVANPTPSQVEEVRQQLEEDG